jgi:peptidoglycan/xylan/chitin deacetylase (PgdA/CDA1 family)
VYHRVRPEGAAPYEIAPAVSSSLFQQQIEALGELGEIVSLAELARGTDHSYGRVRFAVSIDDDDPAHTTIALPLLRSLNVPATFFLSGRAMHGLGPYWWVCLEQRIAERGLPNVCRMLGVTADSPAELAELCEGTRLTDHFETAAAPASLDMDANDVRALIDSGMSIGFHTLRHRVLSMLSADELADELIRGRAALADAAGTSITLLAYPHGRANARVARAAEAAGFEAAFAAGGRPIGAGADRFLLGRWAPNTRGIDEFVAEVALRLNRSAVVPPR